MRKLYIGSIPSNSGDSIITARIKRLTEIHEKNEPSHDDPLAQHYTYTARLKTEVFMMTTDRFRDAELRTTFDSFAESLKDEVLKLARAIVRERKGMV